MGCIPDKSINCSRICNETLNEAVKAYNVKLVDILKKFQNDFNVSIFLADSDRMFIDMVDHPFQFGKFLLATFQFFFVLQNPW